MALPWLLTRLSSGTAPPPPVILPPDRRPEPTAAGGAGAPAFGRSKKRSIYLPDGSEIELSDKPEIAWVQQLPESAPDTVAAQVKLLPASPLASVLEAANAEQLKAAQLRVEEMQDDEEALAAILSALD